MKPKKKPSRAEILKALHAESSLRERQQILDLLALPPHERTHFLRVRLLQGGSAL